MIIESTVHLRQWARKLNLPESLASVEDLDHMNVKKLRTIPIDYDRYPRTDAVCLTGVTQIRWIRQLVESKIRYVLHIDGKHKLHHGKWMLVSIGVHDVHLDDRNGICHTYRPLVYMFVKQQETAESVKLLCEALNWIAENYFGSKLSPGVVVMDHSDGFRNGVLQVWPDTGAWVEDRTRITYVSECITHVSTISMPYLRNQYVLAPPGT